MIQKHWQLLIALFFCQLGLILVAAEPYSSELLAYRRSLILEGEIWRLLTCNFHHTNFNHLLLNGGGLIIITLLHQQHYKKFTMPTLLAGIGVLLAASILLFDQEVSGYLGLSGTLHGLFAWGVVADIRKGDKTGYLLLLGLIGKLAWEAFAGASSSTEEFIGSKVLTSSHLYGAIWGGLLATIYFKFFAAADKKTKTNRLSR